MKQYVLVHGKDGNTYVVPMPGDREIDAFRDMVENEIGVQTHGTVYYMSLTELRKRAKAGELS